MIVKRPTSQEAERVVEVRQLLDQLIHEIGLTHYINQTLYNSILALAKPSREALVDKINRLIEYAEGAANICDGIGHRTVAECVRREIATVKKILDLCCGEDC